MGVSKLMFEFKVPSNAKFGASRRGSTLGPSGESGVVGIIQSATKRGLPRLCVRARTQRLLRAGLLVHERRTQHGLRARGEERRPTFVAGALRQSGVDALA